MRLAGHDLGADHLVGAARNKAWTHTTTVFGAETLAERGGGAASHGARLILASAVSLAMRFINRLNASSAPCKLARSNIATMRAAKAACFSKSDAPSDLAHGCIATTVFDTPSPCNYGRGAPFPSAAWFRTMLVADTTSNSTTITPFSRADTIRTMLLAKSFTSYVAAAACSRALYFS